MLFHRPMQYSTDDRKEEETGGGYPTASSLARKPPFSHPAPASARQGGHMKRNGPNGQLPLALALAHAPALVVDLGVTN